MKVAVIGGGSWGTTIASMLADKAAITLWCRSAEVVQSINTSHRNPTFLGDLPLSVQLSASTDQAEVLQQATVVVAAVPSHALRSVMAEAASLIPPETALVSLVKGFERGTLKRGSEILAELFPHNPQAVLSGPNLAKETLQKQPTATVIASENSQLAADLQDLFTTASFRVYTSDDVKGVELAGGLKNVIALAAGIVLGQGSGRNTQAALVTRGLAEMKSLGAAVGAKAETFSGLAGIGDLMATCFSTQSRNLSVGMEIGKGRSLSEVVAETKQVAEGVKTAGVVVELAKTHGVEMPICQEVWAVLYNQRTPAEAYQRLLSRPLRAEAGSPAAP